VAGVKESPRALRVFAIGWLTPFLVTSLLYRGPAPLRIYVAAILIVLAAMIFLLRGSRLAWIFFVLGNGAAVISVLSRDEWGWGIFHAALLLVLFAPETRRYIWLQRT
jgi:hypothetical protein